MSDIWTDFEEKILDMGSSLSIFDYEHKNMLTYLYRFIKNLPEKPIRISYLKHLRRENERIKADLRKMFRPHGENASEERHEQVWQFEKTKTAEEKKVLLYLLFDAHDQDDLEVFQEILKIEESVLFMKNSQNSMFDLLWSSGTIDDFLMALNLVGSFQPEFNILLNEKFERRQTEEICIFLNDKLMSDFEKYYIDNALSALFGGDYESLVFNKEKTKFRTISESFFGKFFEVIKDVIKQKCQDPVASTSADKDEEKVSNSNSDDIVNKLLEFLRYIFDTQNHLCNISVLTSIDLKDFPKSIKDYLNITIFESPKLQFILENNIIWDETKEFQENFEIFNKNIFKDFSNIKDLKQNAGFIFHLLKLSILKKSNVALCTILDQILVEQNKFKGWAYIDEIHDMHTTLVSYAIKWNNIEALKELLKRKARLLLKDDFYEDNLEFFEVKSTELESYFNECMSYVSNNTIICFDFSNFVPNVYFDDDLEYLELNEKEKSNVRSKSKNKKFRQNVQMVRQMLFVAKEFQANKCPNDSPNEWNAQMVEQMLFDEERRGIEIELLEKLESNEKEKTSGRSEFISLSRKNAQMVKEIPFVHKFQVNKFLNDSDDSEFFDEECGIVHVNDKLEEPKSNEKEKTSARSEPKNKKFENNDQMVTQMPFLNNSRLNANELSRNCTANNCKKPTNNGTQITKINIEKADESAKKLLTKLDKEKENTKTEENKGDFQFSNIIYEFAKRDYLQHLLMHPIISTQIFLKWHELIYLHILNFCITLGNLIYFLYFQVYKNEFEYIWGCYSILFVFLLHKSLRIFMRIQPYWKTIKREEIANDYKASENCLKFFFKLIIKIKRNRLNILNVVLLISIIWTTICAAVPSNTDDMDNAEAYSETKSTNETTKIEADMKVSSETSHVDGFAFICMLLLAIDVGQVIKSLPVSKISDYISMLEQVTYTYIKVLLIFSNFIIVFTVCFMTLFKDGFQLFFPSIIKIITMTIGEFNVSDLQLESLSFWHKLLFSLFVFFMAFVIINLLNGLAVSDVQDIRVKATLHNLTYKVNELYSYDENFKFIQKYIFKCKWSSDCFARKKYASKIYIQSNTGDVSHFLIPVRSVKNSIFLKGELGQMFQANLKLDKRIVQTANEILTSKILEDKNQKIKVLEEENKKIKILENQNKKIEDKFNLLQENFAKVCEKINIK